MDLIDFLDTLTSKYDLSSIFQEITKNYFFLKYRTVIKLLASWLLRESTQPQTTL